MQTALLNSRDQCGSIHTSYNRTYIEPMASDNLMKKARS
ncbi:hypothetical protein CES86_1053 [Brucella lupini]|uniref:Uncharacterized protein n=1 Tax=Brucella lupini TaxID=255457 RepID=A0A256GX57_9HYPH|nr:hypothetical protein CES86_1053 [Brucella lupini]